MKQPKILVTSATGRTGSAVVAQLREKGYDVRAMVRKRDARSERLERLGAEAVVADLFDYDQLLDSLRGTQRAYYCPPINPYTIQSAVAFSLAAQDAKLESVVVMSQWLANPAHPALTTRQHWLTDRLFGMLPKTALTVLNPGFFAEYPYLQLMPYAAHLGVFPFPADLQSRNAPPSNADIARVAVAALTDPDRHNGKTYRPTGPSLISIRDIAQILSRVLGRTVLPVQMPLWMFYKAARLDNIAVTELSQLDAYFSEHSRGTFALQAPTNHVLETTGCQPEDFETIARRHAALPQSKPTLANTLRTFFKFMAVPFTPGLNPERFVREQFQPVPPMPRLSASSERWQSEHNVFPSAPIVAPFIK